MSTMRSRKILTAFIKNKRGNVLAIGKNNYEKTHPYMYSIASRIEGRNTKKIFLHAEIDAIVKCRNLEDAYKIEIFRINKAGKYATSKPCPICFSAILETNIEVIGYIDENGNYVERKVQDMIKEYDITGV